MSRIRQLSIGTAVVFVLIIVAGWFLMISPQHSHASSLRGQASSQQQQNLSLQSQISLLGDQAKQITQEQARLAAIQSKLPSTPDLASYVRSLTAAAAATHVDLLSIAPGTPAAVTVAAPAVPAPAASPTASASASPAATATGSATTAGSTSVSTPADALQAISVSLGLNGDYYSLQQFLTKLEQLPRTTEVSSVSLAPGTPLQSQSQSTSTASGGGSSANTQWKTLQGTVSLTIFEAAVPAGAAPAPVVGTGTATN